MKSAPDNLDEALRAVMAGDLDALTPEQVARLEDVLNDEPAIAARLADVNPAPDGVLAAALEESRRIAAPSEAAWAKVWERVEAAAPVAIRHAERSGAARILRLWKPLAAAAACLLLVLLWRLGSTSAPTAMGESWPLQLATSVEIDQLEVPEGSTPFVISTGGDDAIELIWVLQDRS